MITIHNGVIFHRSENNHIRSFYPHQPLPNDAPTEVQIAAAELWTPEFVAEWVAQQNPAPTLEEAIGAKVAEIKQHYSRLSFEYQGHVYQSDKAAVADLTASLLVVQTGLLPAPPPWRTMDNEMVSFTSAEFVAFATAVFQHKEGLFTEMVGHVDAVRALATVEAVQAYSFG
jgi:hypothetical protein